MLVFPFESGDVVAPRKTAGSGVGSVPFGDPSGEIEPSEGEGNEVLADVAEDIFNDRLESAGGGKAEAEVVGGDDATVTGESPGAEVAPAAGVEGEDAGGGIAPDEAEVKFASLSGDTDPADDGSAAKGWEGGDDVVVGASGDVLTGVCDPRADGALAGAGVSDSCATEVVWTCSGVEVWLSPDGTAVEFLPCQSCSLPGNERSKITTTTAIRAYFSSLSFIFRSAFLCAMPCKPRTPPRPPSISSSQPAGSGRPNSTCSSSSSAGSLEEISIRGTLSEPSSVSPRTKSVQRESKSRIESRMSERARGRDPAVGLEALALVKHFTRIFPSCQDRSTARLTNAGTTKILHAVPVDLLDEDLPDNLPRGLVTNDSPPFFLRKLRLLHSPSTFWGWPRSPTSTNALAASCPTVFFSAAWSRTPTSLPTLERLLLRTPGPLFSAAARKKTGAAEIIQTQVRSAAQATSFAKNLLLILVF